MFAGSFLYTIQPEDTIWDLVDQYDTTVEEIMDANPDVDPDNLVVGQVISILAPPAGRGPGRGPGREPGRGPGFDRGRGFERRPEFRQPYYPYYPYNQYNPYYPYPYPYPYPYTYPYRHR